MLACERVCVCVCVSVCVRESLGVSGSESWCFNFLALTLT